MVAWVPLRLQVDGWGAHAIANRDFTRIQGSRLNPNLMARPEESDIIDGIIWSFEFGTKAKRWKEIQENPRYILSRIPEYKLREMEFELLIERMDGGDKLVRTICVLGLGRIRDIRAIEPLIGALKDEESCVRHTAVNSLGTLSRWGRQHSLLGRQTGLVVEALIEVLKDDEDLDVRSSAVYVLGNIGDERAIEPIIEVLKADDEYPSKKAELWKDTIHALVKFGDERAIEPLIDVFQYIPANSHPWNWGVRLAAVKALEEIGDERAIEVLIEALDDWSSISTQRAAISALEKIADESVIESCQEKISRIRKIR